MNRGLWVLIGFVLTGLWGCAEPEGFNVFKDSVFQHEISNDVNAIGQDAISLEPNSCLNKSGKLQCRDYQIFYNGKEYPVGAEVQIEKGKLFPVVKKISENKHDIQFIFIGDEESEAYEISEGASVDNVIKKWSYDFQKFETAEMALETGDVYSYNCIGVNNNAVVQEDGVHLTSKNNKNRTVVVVGKKNDGTGKWHGVLRPRSPLFNISWTNVFGGNGNWFEFASSYQAEKTIKWENYSNDYSVSLFGAMVRAFDVTPLGALVINGLWGIQTFEAIEDDVWALAAANMIDLYEWLWPAMLDQAGVNDPATCPDVLLSLLTKELVDSVASAYIKQYDEFDGNEEAFQKSILDATMDNFVDAAKNAVKKCLKPKCCDIPYICDAICLIIEIADKFLDVVVKAIDKIAGVFDVATMGPYCKMTLPFDMPCQPNCDGKKCGSDGCEGSCGECDKDEICQNGQCVTFCQPDCTNIECGPDPVCGELCGGCPAEYTCQYGFCIPLGPGQLKWKFGTKGKISSSPAIGDDGTIYVGSDYLYAVNPDGTSKWKYSYFNTDTYSSPAIGSDGTIYVGRYNDPLCAVNPDGTLKWSYVTKQWITSSPVIGSDGTIYIGGAAGFLFAIDLDGELKWKFEVGGWIDSSPSIGNDSTIYVGVSDYGADGLYAINPDGTLKWKFQVAVKSSPAIGSDGTIYVGLYAFYLDAVNSDGTLKWESYNKGVTSSVVIGIDESIYVGREFFDIRALDLQGKLKWDFETDGEVYSSPAIGNDGTVYVGSDDHYFYAIDLQGELKWKFKTEGMIRSSPAIGNDGTIYVGSDDKYLYAFFGVSPLAQTSWPKLHHDNKNTGLYTAQP